HRRLFFNVAGRRAEFRMAPLVWPVRQAFPAHLSRQEPIGNGLMGRERNVNSMLHIQSSGHNPCTHHIIRGLSQSLTKASHPAFIEPRMRKNGMTTQPSVNRTETI